jgi:hypothetical protein
MLNIMQAHETAVMQSAKHHGMQEILYQQESAVMKSMDSIHSMKSIQLMDRAETGLGDYIINST